MKMKSILTELSSVKLSLDSFLALYIEYGAFLHYRV